MHVVACCITNLAIITRYLALLYLLVTQCATPATYQQRELLTLFISFCEPYSSRKGVFGAVRSKYAIKKEEGRLLSN